jgi:AcrR family transcriptional regulator
LTAARKSSQRARLLAAIRRVALREGYPATSIAAVIAEAGVSRPTFYEYFKDKDACFLAALAEIQQGLQAEVARALAASPPDRTVASALNAVTRFATAQPERARLLLDESMTGGRGLLDARDRWIARLAAMVERAIETLPPGTAAPDVSALVLLGTSHRLLGRRLRRGEFDAADVTRALEQWTGSCERPIAEHRWRALRPTRRLTPWDLPPETILHEPAALYRAQRRDPKALAENQRRRLIFAAATVSRERGYAASSIAEIAKCAGVDRRAFGALFASKRAVFDAVLELGFQRSMAVTARAFSIGADWPERIWEAGRGFAEFFQRNPTLAHVGFVEPYAIGPDAARRVEDSFDAFTIFLREGLRVDPTITPTAAPPAFEAIATSVFETGYLELRRNTDGWLAAVLPHVVFLLLAPFIGAAAANRFIEAKLARERTRTNAG